MKAKAKKNEYVYDGEEIKWVEPKSSERLAEAIKKHEELHQQFKDRIKVAPPKPTAQRFPVYLTMEEISHIILAVEYVDQSEYCDNSILDIINAKLGSALASHYLGDL